MKLAQHEVVGSDAKKMSVPAAAGTIESSAPSLSHAAH